MTGEEAISRRSAVGCLVGGALGVAALGGASSLSVRAQTATGRQVDKASLGAAAAEIGCAFGSAFAWSSPRADRASFANPRYAALLERECQLLVPENELKWQRLRPAPGRFDFSRFDAMMAYARARGFAVRGHTLLWHQPKWMPAWEASHDFGSSTRRQAGETMLTDHVETVCARYGASIYSYDVVNEAVNPDGSGLYETALSRAIGGAEPTLDLAFHSARAAAPHAELVYNDYMSWESGHAPHRDGVLRLLEGFRARGVPVDTLGIQSHLVTQGGDARGSAAPLEREWRRFLDAVTAMGYRLAITEFDVRDNGLPANPSVRDDMVADYARAYFDLMLSYPGLRDILVWGLSDRYSWIEGFEPRSDGAARRPSPYDANLQPKPLRTSIRDAFLGAARGLR